MNKAILTLIGFLLFIIGFAALVLSLVGVKFAFLRWIDAPGSLFGFVVRLLMILGGIVLVVLTQTDWKSENQQQD